MPKNAFRKITGLPWGDGELSYGHQWFDHCCCSTVYSQPIEKPVINGFTLINGDCDPVIDKWSVVDHIDTKNGPLTIINMPVKRK